MLRRLCSANVSRAWASQPLCRSVPGTRITSLSHRSSRQWCVAAKPVVVEKRLLALQDLAVPRCRQGFQSRLFSMSGGNNSTSDAEKSLTEDYSESDRYKDYRGLAVLKFIGFEVTKLSGSESTGRFVVSENSCQPFNVLHGGTTAYIAESLASVSATIAADFKRVAGIELTCSHLLSMPLGSEVEVAALPLRVGTRIQVWEVKFHTLRPEKSEASESGGTSSKPVLAAICRVTLIVGLPITPESKL